MSSKVKGCFCAWREKGRMQRIVKTHRTRRRMRHLRGKRASVAAQAAASYELRSAGDKPLSSQPSAEIPTQAKERLEWGTRHARTGHSAVEYAETNPHSS